jgi:FixJ family two-component response regulator
LVADVQMSEMTGVELHRKLVDAGYPIPTILVTAYPDEVVRNRALKNGVVYRPAARLLPMNSSSTMKWYPD